MYIIAAQRHGLIQCTHVRWNPGLSDTATAGRYKGVSRTKGPMAGISYRHDTATKCGAGHKSALDALALCPLNLRSITDKCFFYFNLRNEIRKSTPSTKRDEGYLTSIANFRSSRIHKYGPLMRYPLLDCVRKQDNW